MADFLYFQCLAGISGDMFVSSLLDLGVDFNWLKKELRKIPVSGYRLKLGQKKVNGILCKQFILTLTQKKHTHTSYRDIVDLFKRSKLKKKDVTEIIDIMALLAQAEGRIHDQPMDTISFHEVGALDSIIDIAAAVLCRNQFKNSRIIFSDITLGSGSARSQHGIIPIPAPATVELLKDIPVTKTNIPAELITPTGAVLIKYFTDDFNRVLPAIVLKGTGYGAGTRNIPGTPNFLRVLYGSAAEETKDAVTVIETNIDDTTPEIIGTICDQLWHLSINDLYTQPITMKKYRTGLKLTVLCDKAQASLVITFLLNQAVTLGVRYYEAQRVILKRKTLRLDTPYGHVRYKTAVLPDQTVIASPEYEDLKKISKKKNIPVNLLYRELINLYNTQ